MLSLFMAGSHVCRASISLISHTCISSSFSSVSVLQPLCFLHSPWSARLSFCVPEYSLCLCLPVLVSTSASARLFLFSYLLAYCFVIALHLSVSFQACSLVYDDITPECRAFSQLERQMDGEEIKTERECTSRFHDATIHSRTYQIPCAHHLLSGLYGADSRTQMSSDRIFTPKIHCFLPAFDSNTDGAYGMEQHFRQCLARMDSVPITRPLSLGCACKFTPNCSCTSF